MGLNNVFANNAQTLPSPELSEAKQQNLQLKGAGKAKTFQQAAIRNVGVVIEAIGNKQISHYTTIDAGKVRNAMITRGLSALSNKRTIITIGAMINLAIAEHGLDILDPFSFTLMPKADTKKRVSMPIETIREIQKSCH